MNIPIFYSLVGVELGLVVGIGVLAARKALRRQEIHHAALALETIRPVPRLEFGAPIAVPLMDARPEAPEPVAVEIHAVAEDVAPRADARTFDSAAGARWVQEARDAAIAIADVRGEVTSDDVWQACPPPASVDGRLMSAVLSRTEWEIVGYRHSVRGRNAARQIAVWRLKQREAVA